MRKTVVFNDMKLPLNGAHGDTIHFSNRVSMAVADMATQKILMKNKKSDRFASRYQLLQNSLLIISEVGIENVVADTPLLSRQRVEGFKTMPVTGVFKPKGEKEQKEINIYLN